MNNKIYLIVTGIYSDWSIDCFFVNKIDAEKYCLANMQKLDAPYVIEVDKKELTQKETKTKVYYLQEVVFDIKDNELLVMRSEPDRYSIEDKWIKGKKDIEYRGHHWKNTHWVSFKIESSDRKRAEKIAQDYAYQFLSLSKEIGFDEAYKTIKNKFVNN